MGQNRSQSNRSVPANARKCKLILPTAILLASIGCHSPQQPAHHAAADFVLSFGVVADVQYADQEARGARLYRESLEHLEQCVTDWNTQSLDFAIQLGDLIDGNVTPELTRDDLDRVLTVLGRLQVPIRHVFGNHCLSLGYEELLPKLRMERDYYDFVYGRWRFVVLNTMDVSTTGRPEGSDQYRQAVAYMKQHPEAKSYNGAIGTKQKNWLIGRLREASKAGQRVITFAHHPLCDKAAPGDLLAWNHTEIVDILEEAGCVVAHFAGHHHAGGYAFQNGIHHITLEGMVEAPQDSNACGTVHLDRDRLLIVGQGKLTGRSLPIGAQGV